MNGWMRHLLFLLGALLLLLPPWLIHISLAEQQHLEQERVRQTAADLLESSLHLVKNQDLSLLLLTDQLEEEAQNLSARLTRGRNLNMPIELAKTVQRLRRDEAAPMIVVGRLKREKQTFILGEHSREEAFFFRRLLVRMHGDMMKDPKREHLPGPKLFGNPFFLRLLDDFFERTIPRHLPGPLAGLLAESIFSVRLALDEVIDQLYEEDCVNDPSAMIPKYLGSVHDTGNYRREFRGATAPVTFRGKQAVLYWIPLSDQNKAESLLHSPVHDSLFTPGHARLDHAALQQINIGALLCVVRLPTINEHRIDSTIRRYATRGIQLAFVAEDGTTYPDTLSPPLQAGLRGEPAPSGWLVERGAAVLGQRFTLVGAIESTAGATGLAGGSWWISIFCWLAATAALATWFATLYRSGGLATSLRRQLIAGFLFASLFPLTTMFLVIGPYVAERHLVRVQEVRRHLREAISQVELQGLYHRPRIWSLIARLFANRSFLLDARRDATSDSPTARAKVEQNLATLFARLYYQPVDLSLRKIILAGTDGYVRDASIPGAATEKSSLLAQILGFPAQQAIFARGGESRKAQTKTGGAGIAANSLSKGGMLWDIGREAFLSILGPETFYAWIHGKNEPILLEIGIGMIMIYEMLLPTDSVPEFLISLLLKGEYHEERALARATSGTWRDGPVFVFRCDQIGMPCLPASGERHNFLRRIARQIAATSKWHSLSLSEKGTHWLVEGAPGTRSRQFVFVSIADEAPLLAEAEATRNQLTALLLVATMITLVLAASVTEDIVAPLRRLIDGIRAVDAENYAYRVPADRQDELGAVAQAFNQMVHGLEERELLRRMVSSSAFSAATSSADENKARQGNREELIVCFVSCPGLETLMTSLSPEDALILLNRHIITISRILHEAGADLDKLLGTKILAVFPANAAATALATARKLQAAHAVGELSVLPAVGMTIGPVITGILGSGTRRDHTIIGDIVNLAARATTVAENFTPAAVVIDEALHQRASDIGAFEALGDTMVKGKAQPVRLVRLLLS